MEFKRKKIKIFRKKEIKSKRKWGIMFNIKVLTLLLFMSVNCFGITPTQQRKNFNNTIVSARQAITKKQVAIAQKRLALAANQLKSIKDPKFKKAQLLVLAKLKIQLNKISKSIKKQPTQKKVVPKKSPPKKTLSANKIEYNRLFNQCKILAANYLKTHSFENIRKKAMRDFHSKTVPSIKNYFTVLGGSGTGNSSALNGALEAAENNLKLDLDAQEASYNIRLRNDATNYIITYLKGIGSPAALQLLYDLLYR